MKAGSAKGLYVLIALALVAALGAFAARAGVERRNNTVGIVLDYTATRQLAQDAGEDTLAVLRSLREAGAWGVGLEELTVAEAAAEGFLLLLNGREAGLALQAMGLGELPVAAANTYVVWWPGITPEWLARSLRLHLEPWANRLAEDRSGVVVWEFVARPPYTGHANAPVSAAAVAHLGLGLREQAVQLIREAGLAVVPRFLHTPTLTAAQVQFRLEQISASHYDGVPVVFAGQRVAGYPDLAAEWEAGLRARQVPLGMIEFVVQPGNTALAQAVNYRGVRVHAITPAEMATMHPETAIARWLRAVRERGVRLLYVRPLPIENPAVSGSDSAADGMTDARQALVPQNVAYVRQIVAGLTQAGFRLGTPQPLAAVAFPWPLLLLLAAGAAAGGWLLLARFVLLPSWLGWLAVAGATVAFALLHLTEHTIVARQAAALAVAVVFPTLGVLRARDMAARRRGIVTGYMAAAGVSLAGALLVVGFLADIRFMLKVEQFVGVKLAHVAPPLLLVLVLLCGPWPLVRGQGADVAARLRRLLRAQLPVSYLVAAGLMGAAGLVYVIRTGNEGLPVLGLEQQFRQWLETLLVARPRTKEFLIGHPLLVAALDQQRRGRRTLANWLLVGASIGQLSMVNTFSHIHTPLLISTLRTGSGLLLGLAGGYLVARPLVEWAARLAGLPAATPGDAGGENG